MGSTVGLERHGRVQAVFLPGDLDTPSCRLCLLGVAVRVLVTWLSVACLAHLTAAGCRPCALRPVGVTTRGSQKPSLFTPTGVCA